MTGAPGDPRTQLGRLLEDDPADLYENAPMGYLSALPDGRIVKVNRTFGAWTGRSPEELLGIRFQDLLTIGGRVFHETHVLPLLRMQGGGGGNGPGRRRGGGAGLPRPVERGG